MFRFFSILALSVVFVLPVDAAQEAQASSDEHARVVILANANDRESVALAHFYALKRDIPEDNIVALPMSADETIAWDVFAGEIFNPLREWLVERHWIDARSTSAKDLVGRVRLDAAGHRISYLVACRGVPLRIAHDPAKVTPNATRQMRAEFHTNQAAVDGELALLATVLPDVNGPVNNPLYFNRMPSPFDRESVVRVSRLDGPSAGACEHMVTSALEAETRGLAGRAYVDLGGPHPSADAWLRAAIRQLHALDFDVDENKTNTLFARTDRFDAPAIYLGWYTENITGPFRVSGFRFPAGAVALHIHSFSATTLRSETAGWCGPLVALGVTATMGNVFEPYLQYAHRPDLFVEALAQGKTLGAAAYYALPMLSWQGVLLGDPLYRPFARSLDEQVTALTERTDTAAPYVVLRQANRLARTGAAAEVEPWLTKGSRDRPALAVSLRLAQERDKAGDREGAIRALTLFTVARTLSADEFGVSAEAAAMLVRLDATSEAVAVYRVLLDAVAADETWKTLLLPSARAAAFEAGDVAQQRAWAGSAPPATTPAPEPKP